MKKNIAILRGGNTKEIHISIKSADVVFQSIDPDKYTPYLIHIENQDWNLIDGQKKMAYSKR
jgi:D-alanine-D-alanine ligase